ncbi:hypothetical protein WR25_18539 [Diploscapter pachys]|uniref:Uncharacterized protein n=1 Tax=Diploscapter pachys TaxID=2018661 RepID=A0A2A2K1P3_9BILA|nr:hypothetical protein WR25_18539 [Diploscapter pachys]
MRRAARREQARGHHHPVHASPRNWFRSGSYAGRDRRQDAIARRRPVSGQRAMPPAASTASVTSSLAVEVIGAICTGFSMPISIGPITLSPPTEHRDARFVAHAARDLRGLFGEVGELFAGRPFVHRRVGDEDGVALPDEDVDAEGGAPRLGIDHALHLAHRFRPGAGNAGDHRIRFAQLEQRRPEDVAVLVDHPLDIATQIAAAL